MIVQFFVLPFAGGTFLSVYVTRIRPGGRKGDLMNRMGKIISALQEKRDD